MAQDSFLMGLLKWAGGIAATVIGGVLLWHFTQPKPAPPPQPPSIVVAGRVISSDKLLPGVPVALTAGSYSGQQITDSEGRYAFAVPVVDAAATANLKIEASGYNPNPYTVVEPLSQLSASDGDQMLEAVAAPPPAAGGPGSGAGQPPIHAIFVRPAQPHVVLPAYVRRQDVVKLAAH